MPKHSFKVTVSNKRQGAPESVVVADAMQYLAYADQTDTIGYHSNVVEAKSNLAWVTFTIDAVVMNDDELKAFMDEMTTLSRVESVKIHGEMEA